MAGSFLVGKSRCKLKLAKRTLNILKRLNFYPRRNHIVLACMPKSGSTFLTQALVEVTGFQSFPLIFTYGENEQDLYLPALIDARGCNTVTQQHLRATMMNISLLNEFNIRPVVLIRNLFDVVVSIRDHIRNESQKGPSFFAGENFSEKSEQEKIDAIIDMALPWYINYYVSWSEAVMRGDIETLWLTYQDVMTDKEKALNRILEFYNLEQFIPRIGSALLRAEKNGKTRMNVGISGRGKDVLSSGQIDRICRLSSHYPKIEFGSILD